MVLETPLCQTIAFLEKHNNCWNVLYKKQKKNNNKKIIIINNNNKIIQIHNIWSTITDELSII